jgi:tRNA(adenine34) deaminase
MDDKRYMRLALGLAAQAAAMDEVPVGAVIVGLDGSVIGEGYNNKENSRDATCHAEINAIRTACRGLDSWRLTGATLYVTLEPCPMCAGAMVQARIKRLVYGADDPKAGAAGSAVNITSNPAFNHRLEVTAGVCEDECALLLKEYFAAKRR